MDGVKKYMIRYIEERMKLCISDPIEIIMIYISVISSMCIKFCSVYIGQLGVS